MDNVRPFSPVFANMVAMAFGITDKSAHHINNSF